MVLRNSNIKICPIHIFALLAGICVMGFIFRDGLFHIVNSWNAEEYSHSYLIPFVSAYLIWQRRDLLQNIPLVGSWVGVLVVIFGSVLFIIGELSTLYTVIEYAFLIVLLSAVLSLFGWKAFKIVAIPLLLLFFTIPLPNFIYNNLSAELQLISSKIGVEIIRMMGISVYLEGNVIDLGSYKLQVAEACNGLRYLFPLMTLGFISAYLFKQALWKRVLVFLSTIPITIIMNSFRIAVIGWLVEHWGISMAEGFLHDFEGWVVFMICFAILLLIMAILVRVGKDKSTLAHAFGIQKEVYTGEHITSSSNKIPTQYIATILILLSVLVLSLILPNREEILPDRIEFSNYSQEIGSWTGKKKDMELVYINALMFDDYYLADYVNEAGEGVNYYIAYYASQRKGQSAHSPRSCLPGGGWEIKSLKRIPLKGLMRDGKQIYVNRVLTQLGNTKTLVYYWFKQRNRNVTNEYLVKWYLFWDALTKNRTDGALIRITTIVPEGHGIEDADSRLYEFAKHALKDISNYVPD